MNPTALAAFVPAGQGRILHAFGEEIDVRLDGSQTGGKFALWQEVTPPGGGPPPHYHLNEAGMFIILEGRVGFLLNGEWTEGGPGDTVFIPRGSVHTFKNVGDKPSRMFICTSPSGMETFFGRCAEEFAKSEGPDMDQVMAISAEHGIHFVQPDPQPMHHDQAPSPVLFFETLNAFQRTAALKAAIDLDLFTAIGDTPSTARQAAERCSASERGIRILCDYLTIVGFLQKAGDRYSLTLDTATFLNRKSPAYAGSAADFLLDPGIAGHFNHLTEAVKKGGTVSSEQGTIAPEHPVWLNFARGMGPMMAPAAQALAELLPLDAGRPAKVLDVSASHGMYGIAFARRNPDAHLYALDWAPVLEVSRENARAAGIGERFHTIAGDAFEVDLGADYDVVLVPNFLHHFDHAGCVRFLRRVYAALRPGGRVAIVEFVPNPDRVTPPPSAGFSLVMLATTPAGDAYTFAELEAMLTESGFRAAEQHPLPPSVAAAVIAAK